jgi:hypothetical protein
MSHKLNSEGLKMELSQEVSKNFLSADAYNNNSLYCEWPGNSDLDKKITISDFHLKLFTDVLNKTFFTGGDNISKIEEKVNEWTGYTDTIDVFSGMPVKIVNGDDMNQMVNNHEIDIVHDYIHNLCRTTLKQTMTSSNGDCFDIYNLSAHASAIVDGAFDEMVLNSQARGYVQELEILMSGGVLIGVSKNKEVVVYYPNKEDFILDDIMGTNFYPKKKGETFVSPRIRQSIKLGYYSFDNTNFLKAFLPYKETFTPAPIPNFPRPFVGDIPTPSVTGPIFGNGTNPGGITGGGITSSGTVPNISGIKEQLAKLSKSIVSKENFINHLNDVNTNGRT